MRHFTSLLLTLTLTALPLAAHAEEGAKPAKAASASKHSKRKTASKTPTGAIGVDKLKQEVAGRIKHEQAEQGSASSSARHHFEDAVAQVKSKLAGAVRDGKVTQGELKQVRDTYHLMAVKPAAKPTAKKASKPAKEQAAPKAKKKVVQGENDDG